MGEDVGPESLRDKLNRATVNGKGATRPTGFEEDIEDSWEFSHDILAGRRGDIPERAEFLIKQTLALAAQRAAGKVNQQLDDLLPLCESPIEKIFLTALIAESKYAEDICFPWVAKWKTDPHAFLENDMEDFLRSMFGPCGPSPIGVLMQVPINKYRVDFLLYAVEADCDDRDTWGRVKLVIECDGHNFHEKTKTQAKRDKARDRHLMKLGYHVMRFTGSEIWNDPRKCVHDATEFIYRLQGLHRDERHRQWMRRGEI